MTLKEEGGGKRNHTGNFVFQGPAADPCIVKAKQAVFPTERERERVEVRLRNWARWGGKVKGKRRPEGGRENENK